VTKFRLLMCVTLLIAAVSTLPACSKSSDNGKSTATASPNSAANAKKQAEEIAAALLHDDYATMIRLTHPGVVERAGGADKMKEAVVKGKQELARVGVSFKDVKIGTPGEPTVGGPKVFIIVPQTVTLATPKGQLVQDSFLLGSSKDNGATWQFVDGAGLNDQTAHQLFPNLPAAIHLPAKTPPRMQPAGGK